MIPEISGYIGRTQGVKATPIPISSAQSGEKGNGAAAAGGSVTGTLPPLTALSGTVRLSGG